MMFRLTLCLAALTLAPSCGLDEDIPAIEREVLYSNLTRRWYAAIGIRRAASLEPEQDRPYLFRELLPPGGVMREPFDERVPDAGGCPDRVDLHLYLYERRNREVPIGLDFGEEIDPTPVISAEMLDVSACELLLPKTFEVRLRVTDEDRSTEGAEVTIAEDTPAQRRQAFADARLPALVPIPLLARAEPLMGMVVSAEFPTYREGIAGIGVLLRTRVSVIEKNERCCLDGPELVDEITECCFSDPIDWTQTERDGRFYFHRPRGTYLLEVFGDGYRFRPVATAVESPIQNVLFVAERTE